MMFHPKHVLKKKNHLSVSRASSKAYATSHCYKTSVIITIIMIIEKYKDLKKDNLEMQNCQGPAHSNWHIGNSSKKLCEAAGSPGEGTSFRIITRFITKGLSPGLC